MQRSEIESNFGNTKKNPTSIYHLTCLLCAVSSTLVTATKQAGTFILGVVPWVVYFLDGFEIGIVGLLELYRIGYVIALFGERWSYGLDSEVLLILLPVLLLVSGSVVGRNASRLWSVMYGIFLYQRLRSNYLAAGATIYYFGI